MRHKIIGIRHKNERRTRMRAIRLCEIHNIKHLRGHVMVRRPEISAAVNLPCASCILIEQMWKVNDEAFPSIDGLAKTMTLLGHKPARKDSR